jgi:ankyrin repeat protein
MLRLCFRSSVRRVLNELPDSLDETYECVLKEIHKTNRGHVQRLLQCLAMAIRPLRVDEVAAILTFDTGAIEGEVPTLDADSRSEDQEQELLSACPSLITIVKSWGLRLGVVQFSHFSVKEFLTSDRLATSSEDISRYHILPDAVHTTFAQTSLGVLLRLDDRVDRRNAMRIPLAEYAAEYWVSHAQVRGVSSRVMGTIKSLFDSDANFAAWVRIYDIDQPSSGRNTAKPIYYSALCGFYDLVEHLVKKDPQRINAIGGNHDSPLVAALHGGHISIAELLLQHGANLDVQGTEEQTPLHTAIEWPNNLAAGAVRFLLKHGADVNARRKDLSTPLHLAAAQGYFEVVQMLLKRRIDVNHQNTDGETPCHPVPKPTFPRSPVRLSLEYGAEVNSRGERDVSLMQDLEVARVLLKHGTYVSAQDNRGRTPLHRVLEPKYHFDEDRFGVAQLLIECGADVNAQDEDHQTPLHLASYIQELKLVRMLLDLGANDNAEDNQGRTPLHRVLMGAGDFSDEFFVGIAQLLVQRGADVNARSKDYESPLLLTSYFPELKLVRMLLDHGANVNAEDSWGRTPLRRVLGVKGYSDEGRSGVVQLLIKHDADANIRHCRRHNDFGTLLHLASYQLDLRLVRRLVNLGANVNAKDSWGRTPLHRVLEDRYNSDEDGFRVAQLLVVQGADVNARDEDDQTPLHFASYFLELTLVRMLLDRGANVNAKDNRGRTSLYCALEDRSNSDKDGFRVAQLLLERGADVNARDENHETPLHLATYFPEPKLVQMLLDHGANVNIEDKWGRTPLHRVLGAKAYSDEDYFVVAQILMERGADANTPDNDHETPLHLASRLVFLKVAWTLLKHGADLNAEKKEGKTPFQLVRESLRDEMERLPSENSSRRAKRRARRAQGVALMGLVYGY